MRTLRAIVWDDQADAIRVLDQTLLPELSRDRVLTRVDDLVLAIEELAVRGAPALGVAGALGVVLALREAEREGWDEATREAAIERVRLARPTAVNLAWGVDQVRPLIDQGAGAVLKAAREVARADEAANRELSRLGADWIVERVDRPKVRALTHCNTGALATSGWGTALGILRELHERGRLEFVYADETRPLLQGSRLTAYELSALGIAHAVQVDGAAASTILRGLVDVAVVGADRIAANGDTANKVGTLGVALAAHAAGIPFVVAAPQSTVDLALASGAEIPIEERDGAEVTQIYGATCTPAGTPGFNPAFDVTPARFINAVVTEAGVVAVSQGENLSRV